MSAKKQKYLDEYIRFGFVSLHKGDTEAPQHSLKQAKLDGSGAFQQQTSKVVEDSYEITLMIAKNKTSHNIEESLIKPSLLCEAELVLGIDSANKLSQISLPNDTVKRRIDEMCQDIKD
ncbi:protein FAM200C-like [Macrobrachium nipponense]|uniref:protein FAM200C-like n=1 Tax=Macrobrachium nipponense TaxID=159736 RepID=UPI0030C7C6AE